MPLETMFGIVFPIFILLVVFNSCEGLFSGIFKSRGGRTIINLLAMKEALDVLTHNNKRSLLGDFLRNRHNR